MFPGFDAKNIVQEEEPTTLPSTSTKPRNITLSPNTTASPDPNFDCPENEKPRNIGAYEVPSERDLVLLIKKTLTGMFQSYNRKALFLLRDIKEATKAATLQASKCSGNQDNYRKCLRKVNHHCSSITKHLITTIEQHKTNITFFVEGKICNMAAMVTDPLVMIKMLAVEEVGLKFALPAFLRLLSDCHSLHCHNNYTTSTASKPPRRLSDRKFLVNDILTNNILDFIKDSK